ncbi:hypothetical protein ABW21_db0204524 [Orbilia brochopaga]|nr:hypothetical protein ABW21_db0204524 [Drechslerella brochopaga]
MPLRRRTPEPKVERPETVSEKTIRILATARNELALLAGVVQSPTSVPDQPLASIIAICEDMVKEINDLERAHTMWVACLSVVAPDPARLEGKLIQVFEIKDYFRARLREEIIKMQAEKAELLKREAKVTKRQAMEDRLYYLSREQRDRIGNWVMDQPDRFVEEGESLLPPPVQPILDDPPMFGMTPMEYVEEEFPKLEI